MADFNSLTCTLMSNGARAVTVKPTARASEQAVRGRRMVNCRNSPTIRGQTRRPNGQAIAAHSVEPAVFVARSSNDGVRLGVNSWANSTAPLSRNPLSKLRSIAPGQPVPDWIRHGGPAGTPKA